MMYEPTIDEQRTTATGYRTPAPIQSAVPGSRLLLLPLSCSLVLQFASSLIHSFISSLLHRFTYSLIHFFTCSHIRRLSNHYPLTTAFRSSPLAERSGPSTVLVAPLAPLVPLTPLPFCSLASAPRSRRNPAVGFSSSAANPASSADSAAFPFPCSLFFRSRLFAPSVPQPLSPEVHVFTHPPTLRAPPPHTFRPTPPYFAPPPPLPVL